MKLKYLTLLAVAALATTPMTAQTKKATTKKPVVAAKNNANALSAEAKALFNDMLPNTQKVFVIDSCVVDRDKVLNAIPLPKAYGSYVSYDKFFDKQTGTDSYVFINGFGNRCYYTEVGNDSITRLYMCDKLADKWGKPVAIKEINDNFTDICFPYMASDGQTLYFAGKAKDGEGLGKRDIYMTKYDADEGIFMQAENIGLPFNSGADDYAFIIADADRMAWFASSRRQPSDKVCVYAFVPAEQRQNYSADELEHNQLVRLANLTSISETWTTPDMRDNAMVRLNKMHANADKVAAGTKDMAFVVDDNHTYTSVNQFRSDQTRKDFYEVMRQRNELNATLGKLQEMRKKYHNAKSTEKTTLGNQIARLETMAENARNDIKKAEQELRRKECLLFKNK